MKTTVWNKGRLIYSRPKVMGILNVTPDSFSDGGTHDGAEVEHAFRMVDEGADIIDVGGESTRPGFIPISVAEEIDRVVGVVKRLSESSTVPISVDTRKPEVAQAAIDVGADIINDVNGLSDERMVDAVASSGAAVIITHMPRDVLMIHQDTMTGNIIPQMVSFFTNRVEMAMDAGISEDSIILDPGIGFGKTNEQNIQIIDDLPFIGNRFPILVGASRKRFLAEAFPLLSRDAASIEAARLAVDNGASIVRVHDVKGTVRMLRLTASSR